MLTPPRSFFARVGGEELGPLPEHEIRGRLRSGEWLPTVAIRIDGADLWAPAAAWAAFAAAGSELDLPSAPDPDRDPPTLPTVYASAPARVLDQLLYALLHKGRVFGPFSGVSLRRSVEAGRFEGAVLCVIGQTSWYPVDRFFEARPSAPPALERAGRATGDVLDVTVPDDAEPPPRASADHGAPEVTAVSSFEPSSAGRAAQARAEARVACPTCLESIPPVTLCPECGEPTSAFAGPPSEGQPTSIGAESLEDGWLRMHWRPLLTLGAITALICTGIALRFLAPGRFYQAQATAAAASTPVLTCAEACWTDESCQVDRCLWNPPNDVGHVDADPVVAGPFDLPPDASDVLPLDGEHFAVALIAGMQIRSARTGEVGSNISEALHTRRLLRVGSALYAIAPQHIYVVDAETKKLHKTMELGGLIGDVTLGATGRRVLVSLPGAHSIAVIATDFHAEIDRIRFGDDPVRPVAMDDTGRRAVTTTGTVPPPGLKGQAGGAAYVFDPSRLASAQDRVRTSMRGNPVSAVLAPDGKTGYVVLREKDELVKLEWLPSGAVRQVERIATCRQPEEIVLLRRDRRALVRCRAGGALEVFELDTGKLAAHIPLSDPATDVAVSADGRQALVAIPGRVRGEAVLVDLDEYRSRALPLAGNPSRVRFAPDGRSAIVLSDRTKAAWVLR